LSAGLRVLSVDISQTLLQMQSQEWRRRHLFGSKNDK